MLEDKIAKEKFLEEYEELCKKHGMFINFFTNARLEPNPNKKGNETTKEWSWFLFFQESLKKLQNNT